MSEETKITNLKVEASAFRHFVRLQDLRLSISRTPAEEEELKKMLDEMDHDSFDALDLLLDLLLEVCEVKPDYRSVLTAEKWIRIIKDAQSEVRWARDGEQWYEEQFGELTTKLNRAKLEIKTLTAHKEPQCEGKQL